MIVNAVCTRRRVVASGLQRKWKRERGIRRNRERDKEKQRERERLAVASETTAALRASPSNLVVVNVVRIID